MIKYVLLTLFFMAAKFAQAQTPVDSVILHGNQAGIDAKLLVGSWVAMDSLKSRIEFIDSGFEMTLQPSPSGRPYYFSKDTAGKVAASGFFPNWPPFDCELKLLAADTLEVSYSQLGVSPYREKYVKE